MEGDEISWRLRRSLLAAKPLEWRLAHQTPHKRKNNSPCYAGYGSRGMSDLSGKPNPVCFLSMAEFEYHCAFRHFTKRTDAKSWVYLGVRTCELSLCFAPFVFPGGIVITSLFSLFYIIREFNRFLHRV